MGLYQKCANVIEFLLSLAKLVFQQYFQKLATCVLPKVTSYAIGFLC